ncbi:transposase [Mucilaginibacter robiniae]|uniref:Transposase n=1 Tax=Mucilaginibacter robiniae TaxID=2728022 RepID=A0A7L5DZH8_9SPHI|nr:integrase core domain-containing protein [Mucilaginibacter robiniae]QJD96191.1 transposase [Mucilaginibacter robiniae]
MSRKGNCWDNAVAESFFKTMKTEMVYHRSFQTKAEARLAVSPDTSRLGTIGKEGIQRWDILHPARMKKRF